jgi:hypothetical protein
VRWGCAGLVLDSGTDAEPETNFLLQKSYLPLPFARRYILFKSLQSQPIAIGYLNQRSFLQRGFTDRTFII